LLFGCGGGGDSGSVLTEQPLSVVLSETATILSVRTELPSSSRNSKFEAQALIYAFAAQVDSGPNAGFALTGRLDLKGEREDDGVTEVEGRLYPDADPSLPTRAELKDQFEADRKALKAALRADITVLVEELKLALANGAVPASHEPSAAQKEAIARFKAKFSQRMAEYRAAMSARIGEYRAARRDGRPGGDDDDNAAKGYEVHGSIDANGAVKLTISLGDKGKVVANGTIAADGSAKGSLTGPASGDQGSWTAAASGPVQAPLPAPSTGAYEAGLAKYTASCSGCHSAGKVDTTGTAGNLAGELDDLVSNLGRIDSAMNGMTLTAQEIIDLKAFLRAANSPPPTPTTPAPTPTPPPPPPSPSPPPSAVDCAGQAVTWTQGTSTCSATYAGGTSGSTSALSDIVAPTTGTASASCTNGVVTMSAPVCTTAAPPPPPPPVGTFTAGQTKFLASCEGCHSAGSVGPGGSNIARKGGMLTNNLGAVSGAMNGLPALTNQEVLDLQAFLTAVN
jgi:mono/diheme cytochrome c family protein